MRRLTAEEIDKYRLIIINEWKTHKLDTIDCIVEFPLGELIDNLAGLTWAWKMKGIDLTPIPITDKDRFDAQGLEGKIRIHTNLSSAVTIYTQCTPHRCQILLK
jgi:hypothetical protein